MKKDDLNVSKTILPYIGILAVLCTGVQVLIAVRGHQIDIIAQILTLVIAAYYAYSQITTRLALNKVRFGRLIHHVTAFVIVNLSFHVHAAYLIVSGKRALIDENWYGVLFGMFVFWGIGFVIHLLASVALRGYEELGV